MIDCDSRPDRLRLVLAAVVAVAVVGAPALVRADDVSLVPGTTVKQAIGGRVRGKVQSESPTEVVVTLGHQHDDRPDRPDRLDPVRRAVGQLPARREPRVGRPARRGRRALQEGGRRGGRQAVPAPGRPVPRGRGARRAGHGRARPAQGGAGTSSTSSSAAIPAAATSPRRARRLARLQIHSGDFAGAEATISALAKHAQGRRDGGRAPRPRCWHDRGSTTRRSPSSTA